MGDRLRASARTGLGDADDGAGGVRVRPGGLRLPRHGPGDHRRRLLRPGDRQRAVGVRAVGDRDDPEHQGRAQDATSASTSNFEQAKHLLEENDGAGNTFKATAKPVLIGTAVVGATTMIFSIIVVLTNGLTDEPRQAVAAAPAVPARPHHRRRGDLLVHRRLDAGGDDRRLPRGRVHQGEHQARGRGEGVGRGPQEGRRDLHAVRAEGHVQHLPRRSSSPRWPSRSSSRTSSSAT